MSAPTHRLNGPVIDDSDHHGGAPIRLTLADALTWLRSLGWGEPLEEKP